MIDQVTWNILFEWITGTRCFLPEGCNPPIIGFIVYSILLIPVIWFLFRKYGSGIKQKMFQVEEVTFS